MSEYTDKEIINRLRRDSGEAFEYVFLKFYNRLCIYVACLIHNKNSAEEIVQEMFCELWEKRNNLEINISLGAYLFKAVYNRSINYINFNKRRNNYVQNQLNKIKNYHIIPPVSDNYPIANLLSQELDDLINNAISALPDQCRTVFLLCRFEDLSYQEIATKLHISVNTVKTQLQRAVKKLQKALQDYLPH